jgi:hypothetical protein
LGSAGLGRETAEKPRGEKLRILCLLLGGESRSLYPLTVELLLLKRRSYVSKYVSGGVCKRCTELAKLEGAARLLLYQRVTSSGVIVHGMTAAAVILVKGSHKITISTNRSRPLLRSYRCTLISLAGLY